MLKQACKQLPAADAQEEQLVQHLQAACIWHSMCHLDLAITMHLKSPLKMHSTSQNAFNCSQIAVTEHCSARATHQLPQQLQGFQHSLDDLTAAPYGACRTIQVQDGTAGQVFRPT
jgi:hypothetical protein